MIVVSHDPHHWSLVADRLILVDNGTAKELDGSLDDYRDMVLRSGREPHHRDQHEVVAPVEPQGSTAARGRAGERSEILRKAVTEAEAELKRLWQRRIEIDARNCRRRKRMAAPVGER